MASNALDKVEVVSVVGYAGDRTEVAMQAVGPLSDELSLHLDLPYVELEKTMRAGIASDLPTVLDEAKWTMEMARDGLNGVFARGKVPITVTARCALSIATLPTALMYHPDAVVVWLDAHGDLNTPETSASGYIGGMALAAGLGLWDSGYGAGLRPENLILAGTRALDAAESAYIQGNGVAVYVPGDGDAKWQEITAFASGRPVYIHLDVDAFDPDDLPGEYAEPSGLKKAELQAMLAHLSAISTVVGVEIAEFEPRSTIELVKGSMTLLECMKALFPE